MQKPLTEKRLENIALFHLERFETSSEKLRQVLTRRVARQKMLGIQQAAECPQWIETVVQKMQERGFVNDERYVENAVRRWGEQGKSEFVMRQKLQAERIPSQLIEKALAQNEQDDLARARIFISKKHLGQAYENDLEKLARAGFSYETAKQALTREATDV